MSDSALSASSPRRRGVVSRWIGALIGFVAGFVAGGLVLGVTWIVTFARALSGEPTLDIPGVISVESTDEMTATILGPLLLFAPLILGVAGALIGAIAGGSRPPAGRDRA